MVSVSQGKTGILYQCSNSPQPKCGSSMPVAVIQNIWLLKEAIVMSRGSWTGLENGSSNCPVEAESGRGILFCSLRASCKTGGKGDRHGLCGRFKLTQTIGEMVLELICCSLSEHGLVIHLGSRGAMTASVCSSTLALLCDGRLERICFLLSFSP